MKRKRNLATTKDKKKKTKKTFDPPRAISFDEKRKIFILPEGDSWIIQCPVLEDELKWSLEDFNRIWNLHPPELGEIKIMGKIIKTPRYQVSYMNNYRFSGLDHKGLPFPDDPTLLKLKDWVQKQEVEKVVNQMLMNFYENKQHYIGWHSDDEKQLIPNSAIYSFSFGAKRRFLIRSKSDKKYKVSFEMPNNSLIIMGGQTQKFYQHSVPKVLKREEAPDTIGQRINVTFRFFK